MCARKLCVRSHVSKSGLQSRGTRVYATTQMALACSMAASQTRLPIKAYSVKGTMKKTTRLGTSSALPWNWIHPPIEVVCLSHFPAYKTGALLKSSLGCLLSYVTFCFKDLRNLKMSLLLLESFGFLKSCFQDPLRVNSFFFSTADVRSAFHEENNHKQSFL